MNLKKTDGFTARRRGDPDPVDIHVGGRIRMRRILLGLSQETVASQLGISFQQLQKYESGANRISASRLYDVAYCLNAPVAYFFAEMPEEVRYTDAVEDNTSDVLNATREAGDKHSPTAQAVMQNRTTLDLIRDFYRITSTQQQRCILDLIRAMAETAARRQAMDGQDLSTGNPA
ncbi:MAG TPA: helix-turn-helix transcriptional regulator [Stellaceae bacterium]|nr:helix-turn-helix transcriptional regulator [Stellaceae bacterium]